jgi:hypothetical protein
MAKKFHGFVGPWSATFGYDADSQRAVNLYPEPVEADNPKASTVLRGTTGLTAFCTLGASPVRGILSAGAPLTGAPRCFAVGGSTLYEIDSSGVATSLGSVGTDAGNTPVQMELNGTQLFIVSAGQSYVSNGGAPTAVGMPAARQGCYIDGYGIIFPSASRNFYISALNDFSTWDALDVGVKESYPDHIGAMLADRQDLWLFGESTIEVWNHTGRGVGGFPFERNNSALIHQGIAAPWSACRLLNGVAWLGQDTRGKMVAWYADGYSPRRVSTYAVETEWSLGTVSDATSYTYVENGHHFWVLNFPTLDQTWVWDATTGWWHQRGWWNGTVNARHRGRCHAFVFDKHLVGDHTSGVIYQMADSLGTDNGTAIHRLRQAPHVSEDHVRLFHHELIVNAQTHSSATAPSWTLTYSDDKGTTWKTDKTVSTANGFQHEPSWRRLGKSRDRIYQLRTETPHNLTLVDAFIRVSKGLD